MQSALYTVLLCALAVSGLPMVPGTGTTSSTAQLASTRPKLMHGVNDAIVPTEYPHSSSEIIEYTTKGVAVHCCSSPPRVTPGIKDALVDLATELLALIHPHHFLHEDEIGATISAFQGIGVLGRSEGLVLTIEKLVMKGALASSSDTDVQLSRQDADEQSSAGSSGLPTISARG